VVRLNGGQMREKLERLLKQAEMRESEKEEREDKLRIANGKAS
jgi:hypothetical protein